MKKVFLILLIAQLLFGACAPAAQQKATRQTAFTFECLGLDGTLQTFEIHTEEATVGTALLAEGLIDGEEGPYGLYVKTVCGMTADYETDGRYWAFYIDGEYATCGVDTTPIEEGHVYRFAIE